MPQLVWLVTGCSTGFGALFVKSILARGDHAIATARNTDSLTDLEKLGAKTLQLDVAASPAELTAKVQQAVDFYGRIDVLLSNAGYAQYGPMEEISPEAFQKQFDTNTMGTFHLLQAIMPHWRAQQSGFLVVNSSIVSRWNTMDGMGSYAMSKAALDRLVTYFTAETAHLGYIRTLIIHPGHHRTEITLPTKHLPTMTDVPTKHYAHLRDYYLDFVPNFHGQQPGDTGKCVEVVVDLVKGEGCAGGKTVPAFMPLGRDAWECAKADAEETLRVLREWEAVITSTEVVVEEGKEVNGDGDGKAESVVESKEVGVSEAK